MALKNLLFRVTAVGKGEYRNAVGVTRGYQLRVIGNGAVSASVTVYGSQF